MGERFWSTSNCRPDVWWYGISGQGCWYWTARFGQYWVSGGVHQKYSQVAYECGMLGVPVKSYGWISEFGNNGQWFEGGCIVWSGTQWVIKVGDWGQTAGRLAGDEPAREVEGILDEPVPEVEAPELVPEDA